MELFYAPFACSLVPRIVARELDVPLSVRQVEVFAKTLTDDGRPYIDIAPLEMVPLLRFDDGETLSEVQAIVFALADHAADRGETMVGAAGSRDRLRIVSWMSYVASEVHKRILWPRGNQETPREVGAYAKQLAPATFDHLERRLATRRFIATDTFSAADAYLAWVLTLAPLLGLDIGDRPSLTAYRARLCERESVAGLVAEEQAQLMGALARQKDAMRS